MKIADLMTRDVVSIELSSRLGAALQLLREHDIRHLPVVAEGELRGILSDRDIRTYRPPEALVGDNVVASIELLDTPLWRVMTSEVLTAGPEESIDRALDLFVDHRVGAICVVEGGLLVGIVSYIDALRALRDERRAAAT